MPLKIQTKSMHTVDYFDLEKFIQEQFNHPNYSFVADQEASNDSDHSFTVGSDPMWTLDDYDKKRVLDFENGKNPNFITRSLLQTLFEKGLIPEGDYLIEVCW